MFGIDLCCEKVILINFRSFSELNLYSAKKGEMAVVMMILIVLVATGLFAWKIGDGMTSAAVSLPNVNITNQDILHLDNGTSDIVQDVNEFDSVNDTFILDKQVLKR